jgi:hypothetical protein
MIAQAKLCSCGGKDKALVDVHHQRLGLASNQPTGQSLHDSQFSMTTFTAAVCSAT